MATWRAYCAKKGKPATTATLKAMTQSEWEEIFKTMYWDKCKADLIQNQSVASLLVDFAWHSGINTAIKKLQGVLKVTTDGIIGWNTLKAVNTLSPRTIFENLRQARIKYLNDIVKSHPSQKKFLRGWTNRVNALSYDKLS